MNKLLIIFVMIILGASCTKKTEVSGTVYDAFNNPLSFANISIFSESDGGWNIATSDSKGYFIFYFKANKKSKVTIQAYKSISYGVSYFSKSEQITAGKTQVIDLYP